MFSPSVIVSPDFSRVIVDNTSLRTSSFSCPLFARLQPDEFDESVPEPDARVAPVAERLVDRRPAATEGDPVPHLVGRAVRGFYCYSATHPQRPAATEGRIFDYADRGWKFLFNLLASFLVEHHQPTCRTMVCLADDQLSR